MKKILSITLSLLMLLAVLTACGSDDTTTSTSDTTSEASEITSPSPSNTTEAVDLYVLAAASLTDVLTELQEMYNVDNPDVNILFNFDSSGTLQTQIEEGAPADIFFSAAQKQMTDLDDAGLMVSDTIVNILENKVVLIKPAGSDLAITSFEEAATSESVSMVAIGNSDVPVGQYTETIFTNLGIWDQLSAKANLANNVRQVLDWVSTGNADCGFVYATDAAIDDGVEVITEAPEGSANPVIYPAGVVEASTAPEQAGAFIEFMQTDEALAVFEKYGFTIYSE